MPGETVRPSQTNAPLSADSDEAHAPQLGASSTELFETTANNSSTGQNNPSDTELALLRSGDRIRFVGAATRRIARGLDLDEIVLGLCRATVSTFADSILVYLREPIPVGDERPTGPLMLRLRRTDGLRDEHVGGFDLLVEPEQTTPDHMGLLTRVTEILEVRSGSALSEVLRGVRPVFGDLAHTRAALTELLGNGVAAPAGRHVILAPLRGRRRVTGVAAFLRWTERPAFDSDDLLVAAQLATHTALGVDKAVLYGREAYIADKLQRTMLPERLPSPPGVRFAVRYLPAAETASVGGDWYDAIPLSGSRVALVIGDVMGHSMTSAAIMGQLRTTAQTLAGMALPPEETLRRLDTTAQSLGSDRMATCLCAIYDPLARRITLANAGHPPPVLLHADGRAEVMEVPANPPIGTGWMEYEAIERDAPTGATLLLYTDGLVESRLRDIDTGIEQLRRRLSALALEADPDGPPSLEALCDGLLGMLGPGDRDDDIAVLAARFDGLRRSDTVDWTLATDDSSPRLARRLTKQALGDWDLLELTDAAELLVSEVVTNAVRHARGPITLRLTHTGVLRCEVTDGSSLMPRRRWVHGGIEAGRGLYVVNRLALRWGVQPQGHSKVVWFELALPERTDPSRP
ncbi:ATP-binding SpoIIE family protein phosphatase [Streptomyces phaeolivaceus]|uniref:ATP-binding SpoIIE family protein phosphatase n=1 Tax=Streptomyces phaeolivaceus TaxID=2653200 RepID=UPI001D04FE92|nr:SpoIIE family protein phosphatase [Streptomyces phaeolivaceus]